VPSKRDVKCKGSCGTLIARQCATGYCQKCYNLKRAVPVVLKPVEQIATDRDKVRSSAVITDLKAKYAESLKTIEGLEHDLNVSGRIAEGIDTYTIHPQQRKGTGKSEGTIVAVFSDTHLEERVKLGQVNGLNEHNIDISRIRMDNFFKGSLRLTRLLQQDIVIPHMILPLLGDFISNDIHEEFAENNDLQPIYAILEAQNRIASGIDFLLNHSKLDLVLPCHSGNHARTTKTTRVSSENGHSLEYFMYQSLAKYYRGEKRLQFIVPEGYHSFVDVYGMPIRFHHGHEIKYQGGVGGIYIPVNKAINEWNKSLIGTGKRVPVLDVFGHFHQAHIGPNFISNGSTIGYNAFALSIKAAFETPRQQLFLMDRDRGRTATWPVLVS